jgi:hypothetical protein
MSRDEAVRIARRVADRQGWPWIEPVQAVAKRTFPLVGRRYWQVETNYKLVARSVQMQLDRATVQVLRMGDHPC